MIGPGVGPVVHRRYMRFLTVRRYLHSTPLLGIGEPLQFSLDRGIPVCLLPATANCPDYGEKGRSI